MKRRSRAPASHRTASASERMHLRAQRSQQPEQSELHRHDGRRETARGARGARVGGEQRPRLDASGGSHDHARSWRRSEVPPLTPLLLAPLAPLAVLRDPPREHRACETASSASGASANTDAEARSREGASIPPVPVPVRGAGICCRWPPRSPGQTSAEPCPDQRGGLMRADQPVGFAGAEPSALGLGGLRALAWAARVRSERASMVALLDPGGPALRGPWRSRPGTWRRRPATPSCPSCPSPSRRGRPRRAPR